MEKKRNLKPFIIGAGSLFGAILICLIYLFMSSFKMDYELKTFDTFWKEEKISDKFFKADNSIELKVPNNVVNTEVLKIMKALPNNSHYKIDNVFLDSYKRRININGSLYGIKLPISMPFELENEGKRLILNFGNINIGKQDIKLSEKRSNKLKSFLFKDQLPILIDMNILFNSDLVHTEKIEWAEDGFNIYAKINDKLIKQELKTIKQYSDIEILDLFERSNIESEKKAAEFIKEVDDLNENEIQSIINAIIFDNEILKNILSLVDSEIVDEFFDKYGNIFKNIDKNLVLEKRIKLLSEILLNYSKSINLKLDNNYFSIESMYINKGQPYSFLRKGYITIENVVKEQNLNIAGETYNRMAFCYDKENDLLLISYKLNKEIYLVTDNTKAITISKEAYENKFIYESISRVSRVNDKKTWDSLEDEVKEYFQTEDVFIRYMKADDKYAFVIASPKYNYQNFRAIAFEKRDEYWVIIEEDIKSLIELNREHPNFNLETATNEIENVSFYHLGDDMYKVILEDLVYKGIIDSTDNYSIEYCSYGNDYIAFLLSNNKEYVYKVYSMYLQAVYDKETAIKMWDDLPEIITLQEQPLS